MHGGGRHDFAIVAGDQDDGGDAEHLTARQTGIVAAVLSGFGQTVDVHQEDFLDGSLDFQSPRESGGELFSRLLKDLASPGLTGDSALGVKAATESAVGQSQSSTIAVAWHGADKALGKRVATGHANGVFVMGDGHVVALNRGAAIVAFREGLIQTVRTIEPPLPLITAVHHLLATHTAEVLGGGDCSSEKEKEK